MDNNLEQQNSEDQLRDENAFLKMKMMLENGAEFGAMPNQNLPADLENAFLKQVLAFEQQYQQGKTTTVFSKIGSPAHFKPIDNIPDEDIGTAWQQLKDFMAQHGVMLDALSPNVTDRELYRFTTEELFNHETDDMDLPGMNTCFIYDEFYPDYKYDNARHAVDDCLKLIFTTQPEAYWLWMSKQVRINNGDEMTRDEFIERINRFKDAHVQLELTDAEVATCDILETNCVVTGKYAAIGCTDVETINYTGDWTVTFHFDDNSGEYAISHVQIGELAL